MISLAVSRGGRGVGVGRKVMEFCGSIVRALWHGVSPAILDAVIGERSLSDHLSRLTLRSNRKPDVVALEPYGPKRIHQSSICRIQISKEARAAEWSSWSKLHSLDNESGSMR